MQIVKLPVTAGKVQSWSGQARYFSLYKATGGVKISTNTGINTNFYQGIGGDISGGQNQLCTQINFIAEETQTIEFAVSDILVTDNRIAGEVEVNGVVRVDSSALGGVYIASHFGSKWFALKNPVGSGKVVAVEKVIESALPNAAIAIHRAGSSGLQLDYTGNGYQSITHAPSIKDNTESKAEIIFASITSGTWNANYPEHAWTIFGSWGIFSMFATTWQPVNPLLLNEGDQLLVGDPVGAVSSVSVEFQEKEV